MIVSFSNLIEVKLGGEGGTEIPKCQTDCERDKKMWFEMYLKNINVFRN